MENSVEEIFQKIEKIDQEQKMREEDEDEEEEKEGEEKEEEEEGEEKEEEEEGEGEIQKTTPSEYQDFQAERYKQTIRKAWSR